MTGATRPVLVLPPSAQAVGTHLPVFVEHGGELVSRHPADATDARLYGFVVAADHDLLATYCERMFNHPSGGSEHWEAVGDEVLLNFVDIPTLGSTDPEDIDLGACHEREVAIWFPVVDRHRHRFAWAVPYMFVDSAQAMAGGREVYGFPKQLATVMLEVDDKAPAKLAVDTVTLKVHAPDSMAKTYRVLTVERPGDRPALEPAWSLPAHALREMLRAAGLQSAPEIHRERRGGIASWFGVSDPLPDVATELLFCAHLIDEDIPMLLLKQFRDAHQQGAACYQAIVRADMQVSVFRHGGLLPDGYQISLAQLDGEPITRELGLAPKSEPRAAFWLDFDFIVRLGDILWEARGARP